MVVGAEVGRRSKMKGILPSLTDKQTDTHTHTHTFFPLSSTPLAADQDIPMSNASLE